MGDKKNDNANRKDSHSVVSLFSSFGIGDLGVQAAGGRIIAVAELEAVRCEFLRRNHADAIVIEGDLCETKEEVVRRVREALGDEELFLVVATPPCQGMSSNGKARRNKAVREGKRAERDLRNELVLPALDVIQRLRPRYVVFENVVAMRTTCIPYGGKQRLILDVIAEQLGSEYVGKDKAVVFSAYGVPQNRERLITVYTRDPSGVAALKRHGTLLPAPSHARPITLREAIGHFEALDGRTDAESRHDPLHRVKGVKHYDAVRHTPQERTAFDNPCNHCGDPNDSMPRGNGRTRRRIQCKTCRRLLPRPKKKLNGRWVATKGFKTSYKRMPWDKPAPTVTCNFMTPSSDTKLHPEQNRTLSPAEALVLQTVDRYAYDWGTNPSDRELCDALGEAVPPLFFEKLTRHLAAISDGSTGPVTPPDDRDREPRPAAMRADPSRPPVQGKPSTRRQDRPAKSRDAFTSDSHRRQKTRGGESTPSGPTTEKAAKHRGKRDLARDGRTGSAGGVVDDPRSTPAGV